ncbi:helix-turn-helix transcriptional regulator [Streptomyces sp. NPDC089919]|uniref:helix-turn-helix transcriptional regulator n=1 Tax=Streptomyces sp. NPDC089919 TaxID=3155188 RepID=UPI003420E3B9
MYEERPSLLLPGAVVWRAEPVAGVPGAVLPDGCMDLIWADGELWVAGTDSRPHTQGDLAAARFAGVRLPPGTAPALLGVPAYELLDRRVPLADVLRSGPAGAVAGAAARARAAEGTGEPGRALEALAAALAAGAPPPDPLAGAIVAGLAAGRSVAEAAGAVGLGARQLHRRSLAAFGYGPKTLARVLRLRRALALVRRGLPAVEIAAAVGCADQAHLNREFRELAGTTPGAYRSANSETPAPSGSSTTA